MTKSPPSSGDILTRGNAGLRDSAVLRVNDLKVSYLLDGKDINAVDGVTFDLAAGQSLGIVGESGCGKSTLGRGILGLLPAFALSSGSVLFDGTEIVGRTERQMRPRRGIGMGLIFQEPMTRLNPLMRIDQHFVETLRAHYPKISKAAAVERSLETLRGVGIPPGRFRQYPHEFSGGMRQRIMIALALVLQPKVLIADEPTTALDVLVEAEIISILSDVRKNFDTALILVTHNLGIVAEVCDELAVMYAGKIVEKGPTADVLATPQHPYTRDLLATVIDRETTELSFIPGAPPNLASPPPGCRYHPRCAFANDGCAVFEPELKVVTFDSIGIGASDSHQVACLRADEIDSLPQPSRDRLSTANRGDE